MGKMMCINRVDNVATCLEEIPSNQIVSCIGESETDSIIAIETVPFGHKIALKSLRFNDPIIKYGVIIGRATSDIPVGAWVHSHNCAEVYEASKEWRKS